MMETNNGNGQKRKTLGFTPKRKTSIIKVLGVGGGGSNAVNHMFKQGIEGVDFIVCNTDMQALAASPVPVKVQLGNTGLGAGGDPEKAAKAAEESFENIKEVLDEDTEMLFITAGMGGGTGTGAAPVIARFARELGLLTVGIVTLPFRFEGKRKWQRAEQGIAEMRKYIDTLLIISNDKLRDYYSDLSLSNAFEKVDDVLTTAAKGIADIITMPGYVNVDFEDVKTVMKQSGKAIMGSAVAKGENRARLAVEEAMSSPLLNDNDITGARKILLYISTGKKDIKVEEIMVLTDYILEQCGEDAEIIWGRSMNDSEEDDMSVTIIATGFEQKKTIGNLANATPVSINKQTEDKTENKNAGKEEHAEPEDKTTSSSQIQTLEDRPEQEEKNREQTKVVHTLNEERETEIKPEPKQGELSLDNVPSDGDKEKGAEPADDDGHDVIRLIKKKKPEVKQSPAVESREEKEVAPAKNDMESKGVERKETLEKDSEKKKRLKGMSSLNKDYRELESEPAYRRKKVQLSEPNYSSDDNVPGMSVGKDGKNNIILKPGASFLHDSVD